MEFEFLYFLSNFKLDTSFTVQRFAVRDSQQFKVEFCIMSYVKLAKKVWKKFNAKKIVNRITFCFQFQIPIGHSRFDLIRTRRGD